VNREVACSQVEGGIVGDLNEIAITIQDECLVDKAGAYGRVILEDGLAAANNVVCVVIPRPPAGKTGRGWIATIGALGRQSGFDGRGYKEEEATDAYRLPEEPI
jgi:hypothetical protein